MKDLNWFQRGVINLMGIDSYIENYRLTKPQNYLASDNINSPENYQAEEYKMWFHGTPEKLEEFYKINFPHVRYQSHNFWRSVNTNMVRLHSPFAATISNAMGALLFSNSPEISVDANVNLAGKLQKRLNEILDVNDILSLLQEAAQLQSYSGMVGLKLNIDSTIANVPLITIYPKERMSIHKKYNQIVYIDFIDFYQGGKYKLVSRYGRGYINYRLFDKNKKQISVDTIDETRGLKDIAFSMGDSLIPIIFAEAVQNKSGERSDYDGLISSFQALDELYSTMVNYIRKSKPRTAITEDLAKKDAHGKVIPRSDFDTDIMILDSVPNDTGNATKIQVDIHEPEVEGFVNAIKQVREDILTKVSLSPGTLGLSSGGARESSEALEIRERASIRIRQEKLAIWQEKLVSFLHATLVLDILFNSQQADGDFLTIDKLPNFQIVVNFSEYKTMGLENKVDLYMKQYEKGLISIEFALAKIYGDQLGENELMSLIVRTKNEKGIPLDEEQLAYVAHQASLKRNKDSVMSFIK